jgi:hypothetical protein
MRRAIPRAGWAAGRGDRPAARGRVNGRAGPGASACDLELISDLQLRGYPASGIGILLMFGCSHDITDLSDVSAARRPDVRSTV